MVEVIPMPQMQIWNDFTICIGHPIVDLTAVILGRHMS